MTKLSWTYLKPGDVVDIIAPAAPCFPTELQWSVDWLKSIGLVPRVPKDLIRGDFIFAQNLEYQLKHFKNSIKAKDSQAVWCLRGGYGSMRLIPYLLKMKKPAHPKLFIGLSDITALHLFLNQHWNWPTMHGPSFTRVGAVETPNKERKEVSDVLLGKKTSFHFPLLTPMNIHAEKHKTIRAPLIGGNLKMLETSIGTSWQASPRGKILFFEDVGERGYSVDRMLEHMDQAGLFKGVRAIILGEFVGGSEPHNNKKYAPFALKRFAEKVNFPVLKEIKSGHGKLIQCLPFNTSCSLSLGKKASLECQSGGKQSR